MIFIVTYFRGNMFYGILGIYYLVGIHIFMSYKVPKIKERFVLYNEAENLY